MDAKLEQFSTKMEKTVDTLKEDYSTIRAGRANPHLLDKLRVDYYGQPSALQQVANVSVPEARVIQIQPWESKLIREIEKAIINSDLGLTPSNDGKVIRLVFPELTEERRKELVKTLKKKGEECKIAIRSIRRDANEQLKKLEKSADITEDDLAVLEEGVQKATDDSIKTVEKMLAAKEKDIMEI